ncbi:phosphoenolpyruvate--protein phosphotransferase [Shewanella waksmanii]|uniref:phosphoenolpyruvate--protein phosphotransferase n=1 Tax=Shewanella waksmanii TaxID=213783 RepID=UPI00049115C8|nr:phosphoenolpyruvate--protein phosphotransferase [Shewanella waksmanii]
MALKGISVSKGIAIGRAVTFKPQAQQLNYQLIAKSAIGKEQNKLASAFAKMIAVSQRALSHCQQQSDSYALVESDLLLLEDDELLAEISAAINSQQFSAAVAVERTFAKQIQALENLDDPYLSARADDIRCLSQRIISTLICGQCQNIDTLQDDSIVIANDLTPAEFALLPIEKVKGLVLVTGGLSSHTTILAKSCNLPTIVNCKVDFSLLDDCPMVAIDCFAGELHIAPTAETIAALKAEQAALAQLQQQLVKYQDLPLQTQDGQRVGLLANVGSVTEIAHLSHIAYQGVGLFRTEFLFMHAQSAPTEQQQFQMYCDALSLLDGQPLTIRTIDVGADKDVPCLKIASEDNPALGLRGIRYTLAHPTLFCQQLRAILRAANHGSIRLMFPMINQVEELEQTIAIIESCRQQLIQQEKGFGQLQLGIVVETPACVLNLESMLPYIDFISIGSNDLTQYTMAADRGNPSFMADYPSLSPAVIKLIAMAINQAKAADVHTSVCGEIASYPPALACLVGLGVDELSVNPSALLETKQNLNKLSLNQCQKLAQLAMKATRITELNKLLTNCY